MKHYAMSIRRSGAPLEYSSNMYEHLHMALIKMGYWISNKKNSLDHIMKHNQRLEALREKTSENDAYSSCTQKNATLEKVWCKKPFREYI